jgi:long-subunit acyl-CoA synthetase (AMP-forming)
MHLGACPFSIYNTSSAEQIAYVLANAGCRVAVVQASLLERMRAAIAATATVEHLIVIDAAPPDAITLAELDELGARAEFDFDAAWRSVSPGDLLTLIYTSGTTGPPKGAQLTHANELAQCRGLDEVLPLRSAHGALISFLPTAHIADRGLAHYGQMIWGDTVTTCPDPAQVFAHVADARPTRFGAVPRVWEKLKAALEARMSSEPEEPRRTVILGALEAGLRRVRAEQAGEPVGEELRDRCRQDDTQVFAPLRASLGFDRCASYLIGAAPAPLEVFEFFAAIGIPICEVWGMSELSSIATVVPPGGLRFGTVGTPLPGIEIRLAQDGELLVRGPTLMTGYRNEPVKTAEAIDADGWLHSGDIATEDADGYLRIVDRKKELIINAAGKNMSPANIEQQLKQGSSLIGQAITIGDRRPYNVALIVLDPDASSAFAAHHGLADAGPEAMATEPAVLAEVTAGVRRANDGLSRVEQIKRFRVLPCDWPPAGDELTPTMKLKRRPIAEKYAAEIAALYRD